MTNLRLLIGGIITIIIGIVIGIAAGIYHNINQQTVNDCNGIGGTIVQMFDNTAKSQCNVASGGIGLSFIGYIVAIILFIIGIILVILSAVLK